MGLPMVHYQTSPDLLLSRGAEIVCAIAATAAQFSMDSGHPLHKAGEGLGADRHRFLQGAAGVDVRDGHELDTARFAESFALRKVDDVKVRIRALRLGGTRKPRFDRLAARAPGREEFDHDELGVRLGALDGRRQLSNARDATERASRRRPLPSLVSTRAKLLARILAIRYRLGGVLRGRIHELRWAYSPDGGRDAHGW